MVKLHTVVGNNNRLSAQFKGPHKVIAPDTGNKFKIRHLETGDVSVRHADELKQTHMNNYEEHKEIQDTLTENVQTDPESGTHQAKPDNESHAYKMKLRSHCKQVSTCTIENFSETEFY